MLPRRSAWEAELPYERRALTLIQLNRLANYFVESGWLQDRCDESNRSHKDEIAEGRKFQAAANLYAMSDFLVKPLTDPAQFESVSQELRSAAQLLEPTRACCFAEVVHGAPPGVGVLVDIFVSHFWGHLFSRTLAAINAYRAGAAATDLSFWICLFAVNQHSIGDEVGASPNESPFNAALVAASGVVMVVDEDVHPFKRLWCLCEVERVHDLGLAFELIDEGGPIAASSLKMEKMKRVADRALQEAQGQNGGQRMRKVPCATSTRKCRSYWLSLYSGLPLIPGTQRRHCDAGLGKTVFKQWLLVIFLLK
ncbi:unnamed protein product [Polarella glacialis]|uniref:Uncharacterized protein n=1 Tax=Polarella glacialis TaxID=89957 RepID=A0A813HG50_POLGL|nr:unnamed protein product [Polarella glacialis]